MDGGNEEKQWKASSLCYLTAPWQVQRRGLSRSWPRSRRQLSRMAHTAAARSNRCCVAGGNPPWSPSTHLEYIIYNKAHTAVAVVTKSNRTTAENRLQFLWGASSPLCWFNNKEFLLITHTVEHNYISPCSTVGIQLHVSTLYVGHLQVVI